MTTHEITIEEQAEPGDRAFAAVCTDECGWRGEWHHSDHGRVWSPSAAIDTALDKTIADGDRHLADPDDDSPAYDTRLFQALHIPTTDQNGYALPNANRERVREHLAGQTAEHMRAWAEELAEYGPC